MDDDTQRGLYQKYKVERLGDSKGKHKACHFFVLDLDHDLYARVALLKYIDICEVGYPLLARDLRQLLGKLDEMVQK